MLVNRKTFFLNAKAKMTVKHYNTIVAGAGIFGSCAAYHSQKLGRTTLLLEQFGLKHSHGSSHGRSRIIRYAHADSAYIPVVHESYEQIRKLEEERDEKLWRKTGLLWVSPAEKIAKMSEILKQHGAEHAIVRGSEIGTRYPQFKYDDSDSGLIDPMGGVLFADKWLHAFQDEFVKTGGVIKDHSEMLSFEDGEKVEVTTSNDVYTADKLIVTVGSWIGKMLPTLPLKIQAESLAVVYWTTKDEKDAWMTEMGSFPVFVAKHQEGHEPVFAMPSVDYPQAVKFMCHLGDKINPGAEHPDMHDPMMTDIPSRYIKQFLPAFNGDKPVHREKCKYTNSQDGHYVIDFLPGSTNIVVGGCGSGAGFKVAPCVGMALAQMAAGMKTSVDVSFFSLKRFL